MFTRMMARLALTVGIALCTVGYARCSFISNPEGAMLAASSSGGTSSGGTSSSSSGGYSSSSGGNSSGGGSTGTDFTTTLTLHDSSGVPSTNFVMGEPIRFDLDVLNRTNQTLTLQFPDAQIYDFYVVDSGSNQLRWRWSQGMAFARVTTQLSFAPYSSRSYSVLWNGALADGTQLPVGDYRARGVIVSDDFSSDLFVSSDLGSNIVDFTVR